MYNKDIEKWLTDHTKDEVTGDGTWNYGDPIMFDSFAVIKRCHEIYGLEPDLTELVLKAVAHELKENN